MFFEPITTIHVEKLVQKDVDVGAYFLVRRRCERDSHCVRQSPIKYGTMDEPVRVTGAVIKYWLYMTLFQ